MESTAQQAETSSSAENINDTTVIEEVETSEDTGMGEFIDIERTSQNFSCTANQLRQRNLKKVPVKTETETQSTFTTNYTDDSNHNGGGFYECNIW